MRALGSLLTVPAPSPSSGPVRVGPGAVGEGMNWYSERVVPSPSSGASSRRKACPPYCWIGSREPARSRVPPRRRGRACRRDPQGERGAEVFGGEDRVDGDEEAGELRGEFGGEGEFGPPACLDRDGFGPGFGGRRRAAGRRRRRRAGRASCRGGWRPWRESLIGVTLEARPKPSGSRSALEVAASFSWPPPNLAQSGEYVGSSSARRLFSGRLWAPARKIRPPSCSTEPEGRDRFEFAAGDREGGGRRP